MGHIYGNFTLRNARKRGLPSKIVRAMVDTGANTLCLPAGARSRAAAR